MGWRDSYTALVELFPQVDSRLIKGAALEHGSDVGAAAEFILNEVLGADDCNSDDVQQPNAVYYGSNNSSPGPELRSGSTGLQPVTTTDVATNLFPELSMESESGRWTSNGSDYSREENVGLLSPLERTTMDKPERFMKEDEYETPLEHLPDKYGVHIGSSSKFLLTSDAEPSPQMLRNNQEQVLGNDIAGISYDQLNTRESGEGVESEVKDTSGYDRVEHQLTGPSTGVSIEAAEQNKIEVENLLDGSEPPSVSCGCQDVLVAQEFKAEVEILQEEGKVVSIVRDLEGGNRSISSHDLVEYGYPKVSEDAASQCRQGSESGLDNTALQVLEQGGNRLDFEDLVALGVVPNGDCDRSILTGLENSATEAQFLREYFEVEDGEVAIPSFDSSIVARSLCKVEAFALGSRDDSIPSAEDPLKSVNGMDGTDWESLHSNSIHLTHMETLDNLVEEAKTDKEVLIISVEEIRALRLKTDQAESAARQAKDEAARGGLDVLVKVNEMRQILSRAREANAVHAGEVYGEKAVLATEARELRSRLVQVKAEKAKALSALNEIKASLQARIDSANQEREAAELEKVSKEVLAREALAQEELLLAKVAQESRDLDAEAEVCTKLREFLIDRGSIVDALQGEVAVLCEDAEALKKDLDGMSLSCSGGYVHMMSHAGSNMFNSIDSRSGKFSEIYGQPSESLAQLGKFSEIYGEPSESLARPEGGALSSGSNSGSISLRKVPGILKISDKKSWSSLPSLRRALSGSQDLSNSSHSSHSSITASNASSNSRNALIVNPGEESQYLGSEELIEDTKYPSSQSSITSPGVALVEQEVYETQMAMFPGEELELEYAGRHNLDIFRSEKSIERQAEIDDEDWHLLDPAMLDKRSSGSSSSSLTGK